VTQSRTFLPWLRVAAAALYLLGAAEASAAHAADLTGCWEGCWCSATTGHKGPLQATFRRCSPTQYDVEFRGRFFKILPFRYSVMLNVVRDDGQTVELAGSANLGKMFGVFHYRAVSDGCEFVSEYTSCKDSGRFILRRVCCCGL
jgi:hypothetical protein